MTNEENMKQKILNDIKEFVNLCYTFGKAEHAQFTETNFPKLVEQQWDDTKSEKENLENIKNQFEINKKLNEITGNNNVMSAISAFQEGWLSKIK